jgi:large subunit ribosomal protein L25
MELKVAVRSERKKENKNMRKKDQVPAVIYAKHIDTPFVISFRRQDFVKLYKQTGSSTPITLKGEGIDEMVLVHEIQIDPVTNFVVHVDFLGIKKGEKVSTNVPLVLQ